MNLKQAIGSTVMVMAALILTISHPAIAAGPADSSTALRGLDGSLLGPNVTGLTRLTVGAAGADGGADIAIVASAAGDVTEALFTDPRDKLLASGQFQSVTVIHAGLVTPELVDLLSFDAILVWSNFDFEDANTLGDRLADYVDFGGGVVTAVFANTTDVSGRYLGGRWESEGYGVLLEQQDNEVSSASLGTILDPGHPLVTSVSSFAGGTLSARPSTTQLAPGGVLVAEWSDGKPLVAFRDDLNARRVDLGFYPPSDDVSFLYWDSTTDGDELMVNALVYVAEQDVTDVAIQLVPLVAPSGVDTTADPTTLPGQLCDASEAPGSFTLEVWTSDVGVLNTGIVGVYLDLVYDPAVLQADSLVHAAVFPDLEEGVINNLLGVVENFGGANIGSPQGLEPQWARLGYIQMTRVAGGEASVFSTLGLGGVGVFGRTPPPPSEMDFGSVSYGCQTDLNGNAIVNAADLAALLGAWGPNPGHPADFNGSGDVGPEDLAVLLGSWGPCCD